MAERKPSPAKRRKARPKTIQQVKFVAVEAVFKPQVKVRATRDMTGPVPGASRTQWRIGAGRIGYLDEDKAREFQAKGYVEILDGEVKPVSEDEAAEFLSTMTTIGLGDPDG